MPRHGKSASRLHRGRAVVAVVIGGALAIGLALQSVSSAMTRRNPVLAAQLSQSNGEAASRVAGLMFTARLAQVRDPAKAAVGLETIADQALDSTPLSPQAIAVRALTLPRGPQRQAVISAGHALNRRDPLLQGLALEQFLVQQDAPAALASLDSLLRVQPQQGAVLFPVLEQTLAQPATIADFARMLDGSAPWHGRFLLGAIRNKTLHGNLAQIRLRTDFADPAFDGQLLSYVAESGDLALAGQLYQHIAGKALPTNRFGAIDWNGDLPPFDWSLAQESGFYASPTDDGETLDILIRAGKGGRLAGRLIANPGVPFSISIVPRAGPFNEPDDLVLAARCSGANTVLLNAPLGGSETLQTFGIAPPQAGCAFIWLELTGRAWRGQRDIRGQIGKISLSRS